MMRIGSIDISDIKIGNEPIQRVYVGSTLFWQQPTSSLYTAEEIYVSENATDGYDISWTNYNDLPAPLVTAGNYDGSNQRFTIDTNNL